MLADFDFHECPPAIDPLHLAIEARHSNRRADYTGPALTADEKDRVASEVERVSDCRLTWLDAPSLRKHAARALALAERERFRNRELHRELFEAIRFDVGWHATATEGLPPGVLELPWYERLAFQRLRCWPAQRFANLFGASRVAAYSSAGLPCREAPNVFVISTSANGIAGAFACGRATQRAWLSLTAQGFAVQVYAAAALYSIPGVAEIPLRISQELTGIWSTLCPSHHPFMLFRVGRCTAASMRTSRPSPSTIL